MKFSSSLLENAVLEFSRLPGIGKKTALRLVLHLLKQDIPQVEKFSQAISDLRKGIQFCSVCFNISDEAVCGICHDSTRRNSTICVVENIRDVMAIEATQQYSGLYHVLGGLISPLDGIGPADLNIDPLMERLQENRVEEIILALSPTLEGDTTTYFICKKLNEFPLKVTTISRGVAFGGELEYADEMTLARSIMNRLPVETLVQHQSMP